ncbi:transglycosylase domain-containing protein [Paenibacillus beijingensis]|uniref:Penicillin-binding protein n=1 Tax=Paenibacillus beijingensis TaxID=1126833 RepID=A0A0D5NG49_9BACL|nr:penicillin-binding protein 1A [Paenibacillus beijingensis]AJY73952.1 penicillin-binding protein [Paenibacillus beijingensis]
MKAENAARKSKSKSKRTIFRWALLIAAGLIVVGCAAGWGVFRMLVAVQDVSLLDKPLPSATIIYDHTGNEASRIAQNVIEPVGYDAMPKHLIEAVVAIEDKRFFEHDGMDLRGIMRALFTNITAGGTVQGGSTITQQLAKNVFLSHERTWKRKWSEVLLARKIEENYDKPKIMEMYLNKIYFGEGAWGIKRAAETYFGKPVSRLTLSESALLAGLIKAPSALTPYKHPEKAKERRNLVLETMREQGFIDEQTCKQASRIPVMLKGAKPDRTNGIKHPYYVDQIIREASNLYGLSENDVLHGGLRIYTEMDPHMQQTAERVYANDSLFPESSSDQLIQSGSVLVDPRDGGIRALVGGRGDQPFRGFNRAVQLKRQPGSTMKPIAVYTPALERGYSPEDTLLDEPVDFGGYQPKNAGGSYHGEVTLYEALIHSYNVPAVRLLDEIGIDAGMDAAARFGLKLTDADRTLGLALGGLQEGVSPLEMAEAFGVFASDGVRMPAHTIKRIETADGAVLAEAGSPSGVKTTEQLVARTMTAMLEGVVREGTGEAAALADRPVAGKTGTTQMPGTNGEGAKDNWFVGYTPQLVCAVWLGYDQSDSSHFLTTTSKAAAAVFHAIMSEALQDEPVQPFPAVSVDQKKEKREDKERIKPKSEERESTDKHKDKDKHEDKGKGRDKDDEKRKGKDHRNEDD